MTIRKRMSMLIAIDSIIVLFSIYIGYFILTPFIGIFSSKLLLISALTIQVSHHFFAWRFGLYRKAWSYASVGELRSIVEAVSLSILVVAGMQYVLTQNISIRALVITWMLHVMLIGFSRLSWRVVAGRVVKSGDVNMKRTLIIGAGQAGIMIARQILNNPRHGMRPVAFIDDDPMKQGLEIYGIRVCGGKEDVQRYVDMYRADKIVIAIPSMDKKKMADLMKICVETGVTTQTIPLIEDLIMGKVSIQDVRDVKIEDLLGRDEVQLDLQAIKGKLKGKTILITGAGGSIGSEICRQVAEFDPKKLILLGHGENSIYTIDMELKQRLSADIEVQPIIADVQDRNRIFDIISELKPDVIYHAAAHKHVPLMECNPMEAVKNNIFGTKNVADAAHFFGVSYFVFVSTDKAVNPPNIMGATKRFAEMIIQNLAKSSDTKFAAVRFGNVLGSRGSVVPLFRKQIAEGGPITVTDPEMTRYFMTIPEASRLVIQAGVLAQGGEVFVLDMGEPVKIVDLAKNLIKLSGYEEEDIGIRFTGIRPGEKLYEELLNESERQTDTVFPKIHIGKATPMPEWEQNLVLEKLKGMTDVEMKETLIGLANYKFTEISELKIEAV